MQQLDGETREGKIHPPLLKITYTELAYENNYDDNTEVTVWSFIKFILFGFGAKDYTSRETYGEKKKKEVSGLDKWGKNPRDFGMVNTHVEWGRDWETQSI